jgi:hypothetical protein
VAIPSNRKDAFAVVLLALASCVFAPTPSWADEVDVAVDAFAIAGTSVGFTLDETEKTITKAIVRCVAAKKPVLTCARDEVIRRLPADARPIVTCMLEGKPIETCAEQGILQRLPPETRVVAQCVAQGRPLAQCATAELVRRLPPETQAIASCIASGRNFEACAGAEAARHLPPETRDLASCVAQRSDFGKCAQHAAAGTAHRQALGLVEKLKADGRTDLGAGPPTPIRNIINVAEGIREDDWGKVTLYGGAEVYKAAAKIVLSIFLTPVFQPVIGPVVDTIVQNRVDLFARLVKALKQKDHKAIAEIAVEGYFILQFEIPCSLPMPDEMREALCGTVGKIVKDVAHIGGDAADLANRLITHPLNIPATLWADTQDVRERLAGKKTGCQPAPHYYAARYVACYHRAAYLQIADPGHLQPFRDALNGSCRKYYDQCFFSNRFDGLCNPQADMFHKHVNELAGGLHHAAMMYARGLHHALATAGKQACGQAGASQKINEFTAHCEQALHTQVPLKGSPSSDSCQGQSSSSSRSAHWEACNKAIDALRPYTVAAETCRVASAVAGSAATPQAPTPRPVHVLPNRPLR